MIVPGSVNPLLLVQGGDPLDELGKIERSIRFRSAAGAVISRAVAVTGDRRKWKMVFDVKGAGLGTSYCLFDAYLDTQNFTRVYLMSTGAIQFDTSNGNIIVGQAITGALKRDSAAHFEVGITFDSANATAADRMIIEINGVRQSLGAYSAPALNLDSWMNTSGTTLYFGRTGSTALYFDGYLSWPRLTDGNIPDASVYGINHPRTNQWRPKGKSAIRSAVVAGGGTRNGWGTNGFFLPFDDVTSLTTLCYDRSQSDTDTTGNNFAATNISLTTGATYDSMLDTPTNNHSTLSPIDRDPGAGTPVVATGLSNGNLSLAYNASAWDGYRSTMHVSTGKWYVEVNTTAGGATNASLSIINSAASPLAVGDAVISVTSGSGGQTLAIALDLDLGQCTTFRNNVQVAVQPIVLGPTYCFRLCVGNGPGCHINFGQRPYTYAPPTGYKALSTKNLPFPRITPSAVVVTGSGSAIREILAAARAGWVDHIEIIKRRDAAEGWRLIFSDDPTNYLDSSSVQAKAAVPAFGGASYVGYALRVGAVCGIATGRLLHATGLADVVNDGLSNTRKMVILKNEANGTWYVYHPDLTAGKLIYLEQMTAETTDATISAVTASGFTVAAALPAGTYRWIALAETDVGLKLFKHAANAVADGPFDQLGHAPLFVLLKKHIGAVAANSVVFDVARDPDNLTNLIVSPNATAAETVGTGTSLDIVSNGLKIRGAGLELNYAAGYSYVGLSIAATPFRYANAR